jgi:hypothetical protein
VGYGYDDSTTTVDGLTTSDTGFRPTTLQYPTTGTNPSRVITDSFGSTSSMDDEINQLNSILDGSGTATDVTTSTTLDTLGQMGDGSIVSEDFNQPSIGYNLMGTTTLPGTTDTQPNLDQFGRVQDMVWSAIGSGDMLDGYAYTRNLQGDVTSRQNLALDAYNTAHSPFGPGLFGSGLRARRPGPVGFPYAGQAERRLDRLGYGRRVAEFFAGWFWQLVELHGHLRRHHDRRSEPRHEFAEPDHRP